MRTRSYKLFFAALLASTLSIAADAPQAPLEDPRTLAELPPQAQANLRQDMLDHLAALNIVIAQLGAGDLAGAAETAETKLGRASMGKYRASGMGPGRHMPVEMRDLGWGMHDAADRFAAEARSGEAPRAYAALQGITGACMACHAAYRTR